MKKITVVFLLLTITALLTANIKLIEHNENLYKYIITLDYDINTDSDFSEIYIPEWEGSDIVGAPDLPQKRINFIIPENGSISFSISNLNNVKQSLQKPIIPVPEIVPEDKTHSFQYTINSNLYKSQYDVVTKSDVQRLRYYDFVSLLIKPFSFDQSNNTLNIAESFELTVSIEGEMRNNQKISNKFSALEMQVFDNYQDAQYWQIRRDKQLPVIPFDDSEFWFKIKISQSGWYKLSKDMLTQIPEYLNPETASLYGINLVQDKDEKHALELFQIPIVWNSKNDGILTADDDVFFQYKKNIAENESKILWLAFGTNNQIKLENTKPENPIAPDEFVKIESIKSSRSRELADVIIIYPEEFFVEAEDLAQFYLEEYDLVTVLKDQQDIFDEVGGGAETPIAVKTYLEDYWQSEEGDSLEYVILLGSGTSTWDASTDKNRIITYGSSDANFVSFDTVYPDLIIARYPAQNRGDLQFMIQRNKNYVRNPTPGWWRNNIMIMADDENKNGGLEGTTASSGLNHTNLAQETEDLLSDGVVVEKVLGLDYNFDEYNNKPDARNAMIASVNEGRLVWYYIGHGNPDVLGDEDYFRGSQHLRLLDNEEHLPLFLAASCSVGEFDSADFDCIAERLLFLDNGGSIASLAASRSCSGYANTSIMKEFLIHAINNYDNLGYSLLAAKMIYTTTSILYNLLGDPVMKINTPERTGHIYNIPDSLNARQTLMINGDFETPNELNDIGVIRVFDTKVDKYYSHQIGSQFYEVNYTENGPSFFTGNVNIENSVYESAFTVPDDITDGDDGRLITYLWDELAGKDYINYYYGVGYSSDPLDVVSYSAPEVTLWLENRTFQSGDFVSTNPMLIAEIEDDNGINILGSAGHKILVIVDDSITPIDVTNGFVYYAGSSTKGELNWQLNDLEEGSHTLQLVVFDNFNNPAFAEVTFTSQKSGSIAIKDMLPYPNPMKSDGYFTFVLTEDAEVTISIYTITGKKIRTLDKTYCEAGYSQIYWNGKDGDGDNIANNTYFYKVEAKKPEGSKKTEEIGKIIILK